MNKQEMNKQVVDSVSVDNEFSRLKTVIIGLGSPYQRNKTHVASQMNEFPQVPDTDLKKQVLEMTYPTEDLLIPEYRAFVALLEKYGVNVLRANPEAAYSFDYTCPRDIGFVIGDVFYISNMAVQSRVDEYKTILKLLDNIDPQRIVKVEEGALLEGGDVIVLDDKTILVGFNQRSNQKGYEFLCKQLQPSGYQVIPVIHQGLHLDCCLNPLGNGHLLIEPDSLKGNTQTTWKALKKLQWVPVNSTEREHLATNVLSITKRIIIARSHPACARVNTILKQLGYSVEEIDFDGVPATGGSFRCASLVLSRINGDQ